MVYNNFRYNPVKDKTPVSTTGFIDLKTAFANLAIPSQLPDSETDYNGIEDPASILGKPSDVFEALEMQSHINNYTPEKNDSE